MHELAIARGILDVALAEAGDRRIRAISLVIGELSSVAVGPVEFCLELLAAGTQAAGASVLVARPAAAFRCRRCAGEFGLDCTGTCPLCGSQGGELVRGRECYVDSIDVED